MTKTVTVYQRRIADILSERGIATKAKPQADGGVWYNFIGACPMCSHKMRGGACGVLEYERPGLDETERPKAVKCYHPADSELGESPAISDFFRLIGVDTSARFDPSRIPAPRPMPRQSKKDPAPPVGASKGSLEWARKAMTRLRDEESKPAMEYLTARGLKTATIERFMLGVALDPKPKDLTSETCLRPLSAPIMGPDFLPIGKYARYNVPGFTVNPVSKNGWSSCSPPRTYYGDALNGQRAVMVCEGMKDLWLTWQEIQGTSLASTLLITGTSGTAAPPEWQDPTFWARFDSIYLAFDRDSAGDTFAEKVAAWVLLAGKDALRLAVPDGLRSWNKPQEPGKDWGDFFMAGRKADELASRMAAARAVMETELQSIKDDGTQLGRIASRKVDIASAYIDGHLYYPVLTTVRRRVLAPTAGKGDEEPQTIVREGEEVVVIRSDREVCEVLEMPRIKGLEPVYRLSQSDLQVTGRPSPNAHASWNWNAIARWKAGQFPVRPLGKILADIEQLLRGAVWLPHDEDYVLLALAVPVTYAMPVFDAVPLFLVNGPKESGKSALGNLMKDVCFNGAVTGTISAAGIAKLIDESRGFLVLDDLEGIGPSQRRGGDPQYGDLLQALKVSYNQKTAIKFWVDIKTMTTKRSNFFGVKMITNTRGADHILGSRMLRISTQPIPPSKIKDMRLGRAADHVALSNLRDELHAWSFDHVKEIAATYARLCPHRTDRADEISAPLRVMADLAGDPVLVKNLEIALDAQRNRRSDVIDMEKVVVEAVENLVMQGYRRVSPQHVILEMSMILPGGMSYGKESVGHIPEWQGTHWVGSQLTAQGLIDRAGMTKPRLDFGYQFRAFPVAAEVIQRVKESNPAAGEVEERKETSFCAGCDTCAYRMGCPLMDKRRQWEESSGRRYVPRTASIMRVK